MCYEVDGEHSERIPGVRLVDQFGDSTVEVRKLKRLCNPASKNGEDPTAPYDPNHLAGYIIRQTTPPFQKIRDVPVVNQFGLLLVDVVQPNRLFVPATKALDTPPQPPFLPDVDHLKCYKARAHGFQPRSVTVIDEFGVFSVYVRKPTKLCTAADKNDEGVMDSTTRLLCYKVRATPKFQQLTPIFVNDQFGPEILHKVTHGDELCVPSTTLSP